MVVKRNAVVRKIHRYYEFKEELIKMPPIDSFTCFSTRMGFAYATDKENSIEVFSLTTKGLLAYETIKEKFNL